MSDISPESPQPAEFESRLRTAGIDEIQRLPKIAKAQNEFLLALAISVSLSVASGVLLSWAPGARLAASIPQILASGILLAGVLHLRRSLYENDSLVAIALIACILPILGLIVALVINQEATRQLKSRGIPVGFMGVSKDHIQQLQEIAEERLRRANDAAASGRSETPAVSKPEPIRRNPPSPDAKPLPSFFGSRDSSEQ